MNGLEPGDFRSENDRDEIVKTLIQDSEARFNYQHVCDDHENPMLTRFWYRHSTGRNQSRSVVDSTKITKDVDIGEKNWAAIEDVMKPGGISIKVENPEHQEMKNLVKVLSSGLASLDKQLATGMGLAAMLNQKKMKDVAFKKPAEDTKAGFVWASNDPNDLKLVSIHQPPAKEAGG